MYKAILFDLDNTLLNYSASESESMRGTFEQHGLLADKEFAWELFWDQFSPNNLTYWNERNERKLTIDQVLEYSFADTFAKLNFTHFNPRAVAATYWERFCDSCHFEQGAPELLSLLHGKYRMGVVTNGISTAQRKRIRKGEIDHYFDALVISDEVGCWKPDKFIFDTALDQLRLDRTEVIFIGDSLQDDYRGAQNSGIDFCYYNRDKRALGEHINPKFVIEELSDMEALLAQGKK